MSFRGYGIDGQASGRVATGVLERWEVTWPPGPMLLDYQTLMIRVAIGARARYYLEPGARNRHLTWPRWTCYCLVDETRGHRGKVGMMRARWLIASASHMSAAATGEAFGGFQMQGVQIVRVVLLHEKTN